MVSPILWIKGMERAPWSLLRLIEISRIRRRLVLFERHQIAVLADPVGLVPDADEWDLLVAIILRPVRQRVEVAMVGLHHSPGPCQRMIRYGDFIMKEVAV